MRCRLQRDLHGVYLLVSPGKHLGSERISMQLLTFTTGGQQYGIDTRNIVEVLPFISAQELPQQAEEIRGLIRLSRKVVAGN